DRVLIHDGARPFPTMDLLDRLLAALEEHSGAVPALPVVDTLKRTDPSGKVQSGPGRDGILRVQTPQAFRFPAILAAHRAGTAAEETDDAAVAERAGFPVTWVAGEEENFKVTTTGDLARAEVLLAARTQTRTGLGYDVHAFGTGDFVTL